MYIQFFTEMFIYSNQFFVPLIYNLILHLNKVNNNKTGNKKSV